MHSKLKLGPIPGDYADLVEDMMRVIAMHAAIHAMLALESGGEGAFDRRALTILLYAMLGLTFYHLILKRLVAVNRSEPTHSNGQELRA